MKYFQRTYVFFAATVAFLLVYAALNRFPFAVDAATCVTFSILVFANAIRRRGFALFRGADARPLTEILLAHAICLVALVIILRLGYYATPFAPDWLTLPIGEDNYGRLGPSLLQIVQTLALFSLGFFEYRVMIAKKRVDPEAEEKAKAALWREAELEAERMSGLSLH